MDDCLLIHMYYCLSPYLDIDHDDAALRLFTRSAVHWRRNWSTAAFYMYHYSKYNKSYSNLYLKLPVTVLVSGPVVSVHFRLSLSISRRQIMYILYWNSQFEMFEKVLVISTLLWRCKFSSWMDFLSERNPFSVREFFFFFETSGRNET